MNTKQLTDAVETLQERVLKLAAENLELRAKIDAMARAPKGESVAAKAYALVKKLNANPPQEGLLFRYFPDRNYKIYYQDTARRRLHFRRRIQRTRTQRHDSEMSERRA